ncbi:MAG: ImuA family protein [Parasphingopyxis sp.]|uniref:ImuA family protein n=1 Tax=Parasphingopyxis sp. TaxID=1920299 RepID=UPI003FA0661E
MRESAPILSALRARLADHGSGDAREDASGVLALGHAPLDAYLDGGLRHGQLHEIFAEDAEDGGAAAGFAAMLGILAQDGGGGKPLLWLRTEEAGRRGGRFHAAGLAELGGDPAALILATVPDTLSLLRCAADALRCAGLGAVVAECWGNPHLLDLMASRRLTLAAERSGVTALMLRPGGTPAPSTADTRWSVRAAPSRPLAANAPGIPAFDLTLLRRRAGPAGQSWRLEWDRDRRRFTDPGSEAVREPAEGTDRPPALPGALVSLSAGRQAADLRAAAVRA